MSKGLDNHNELKDINVAHTPDGYCIVQLRFANKYLLSMNLGRTGYNDNRNVPSHYFNDGVIQTNTAECRVYDPDGNTVTRRFFKNTEPGTNAVAGWVTFDDVVSAIVKLRMCSI